MTAAIMLFGYGLSLGAGWVAYGVIGPAAGLPWNPDLTWPWLVGIGFVGGWMARYFNRKYEPSA